MLIDDVRIKVKAGMGGNGAATFRRNAQTARGGPDGGNGGNGGNVYIIGVDDILGLAEYRYKKEVNAENGIKGGKQKLFGRNGKDTIIKVPIGTEITDDLSKETLEIQNNTDKILIAKGGKGGRGNDEFKSATNQAPTYAEKGQPGEEKILNLSLKLIADIGLIGLPNAGKSSLLEVLTNARPKIGNYPFTTLEPNLGVMDGKILADIPGLIEGASNGRGLGIKFLKHVEKTDVLAHCIDVTGEDVLKDYETVRQELNLYNLDLSKKPEIILLTKIDLVDEITLNKKLSLLKKLGKKILSVSIYTDSCIDKVKETFLEY